MSYEKNLVEIIKVALGDTIKKRYSFRELNKMLKRMLIMEALKMNKGSITKAAEMMRMKRTTVSEMVESLELRMFAENLKDEAEKIVYNIKLTEEQLENNAIRVAIRNSSKKNNKYCKLFPY